MVLEGLDMQAARALIPDGPAQPTVFPATLRPVIEIAQLTLGHWKMAGGGMGPMRPIALELHAIDLAAKFLGHVVDRSVLGDLKVIEAEALRILGAAQ